MEQQRIQVHGGKNFKEKYHGEDLTAPWEHSFLCNYAWNEKVPLKSKNADKEYIEVARVFKFLIKMFLLLLQWEGHFQFLM